MNLPRDLTATAGRLLLGAAAGVALYLASMALSRTPLPGCGAASTCQDVMRSQWAYAFGIPVSFFGFVIYSVTVLLSWAFVRRERTFASLQGGMAVSAALAAAVWFTALQIFALKTVCVWCCVTHALAVMGAVLLWRSRLRHPLPELDCSTDLRDAHSPLSNDRVFRFTATGTALTGVGLLALGALTGPLRITHAAEMVLTAPAVAPASGGGLALLDGRFHIQAADYPALGSPSDKARTAVLLNDYTCEWCRRYHTLLEKVAASASPPVRIIVLPAARSPEAGEIQRTLLTVFHHNPQLWRSLTNEITSGQVPAEPEAIARLALKLAGQEKFAASAVTHADKIKGQLQLAAEVMNDSARERTSTVLPRLYSGSRVLAGAENDESRILAFLDNHATVPAKPEMKPLLTVLNEDMDLETLPPGQTRDLHIKVRNTGDAPLKLGWLMLDQGCEITRMPMGRIHPGDVATIELRFTSPAEDGPFTRRIKLHSDAPGEPASIALHGRCSAEVAATSPVP